MDIPNIIMVLCILLLKSRITNQSIIDVTSFGAVGNGKSDDTNAFVKAWNSVCKNRGTYPTMVVPGNKKFLVRPTKFSGPCSSSIVIIRVSGYIVAPKMNQFNTKDMWIVFSNVNGLVIRGTGGFSGSATFYDWWKSGVHVQVKPPTLRLNGCTNVNIKGLTFIQPPRAHIAITSCRFVKISNINLLAPGTSPNTDGIDISSSNNINIQLSNIRTGDDCVAINGGSSNINITNVNCGPGHGISIGSLGKFPGVMDMVSNVYVKSCTFTGTTNAARIKTFNGGIGYARKITYEDITLVNSDHPIVINQNYCVNKPCSSRPSRVKVSDVSFIGIRGTTTSKTPTINLNCSSSTPCQNIKLERINIKASSGNHTWSSCLNAHGLSNPSNVPQCSCLGRRI